MKFTAVTILGLALASHNDDKPSNPGPGAGGSGPGSSPNVRPTEPSTPSNEG